MYWRVRGWVSCDETVREGGREAEAERGKILDRRPSQTNQPTIRVKLS